MAVAAAVRARLTFRLDVPVQQGNVFLPGLGCAHFAGVTEAWGSAHAAGHEGSLCITCDGVEVCVRQDGGHLASGWSPTRRLTVGHNDDRLPLILDEHDPYRDFSSHREPSPLNDTDYETWRSCLAGAWEIITGSDPQCAEEIICGPLLSLAPAEPQEKYRPYSSSSGEAFGGINASLPDNASQLAATLVHEFQHIKLGALIHLEPVVTRAKGPQELSELFYAPWRDDPRPIEGLIQGIYAFYGVARFWRARRRKVPPADTLAADFEFALCREQVHSVLASLGSHQRLTSVGRYLTRSLASQCAAWADEQVSPTGLRLAQDAIADHSARWRSHHLKPPAEAVSEAVHAWCKGTPPPVGLSAPPRLVPDTRALWLDTAATLTRHRLTEPAQSDWASAAHQRVSGATRADVLLALGEQDAASRAIVDQLLQRSVPPAASWAVLGRALADAPAHREVSQFLLRFPERARAVHAGLTSSGVKGIDPIQLATWLTSAP
ncbi:HEXXH motif-containing putative peptide modification protein [Streptomyces sp. NPDC021056]|uniref:aKG-HExxH-type peptide beta-hydroxylase n=1 Tax=Streptomyces sp. NPDC021056 TaxID=3155012 RepID=UPI0033E4518F